jgi:GNAT superfamily N-acetyltransferase
MMPIAIHKIELPRELETIRPLLELLNGKQTTNEALDEFCRCREYVYGAYSDKQLCGFASLSFPYWNHVGIMEHMVVAADFRRQGIGQQLFEYIEALARANDLRILTVQTATWNIDAIAFYESQEFHARCSLPEYMGPGNDLLWLDRRL